MTDAPQPPPVPPQVPSAPPPVPPQVPSAPPPTPAPEPAGAWHPDPFGRYQLRWFDGAQWSANVSTNGVTSTDPAPLQAGTGAVAGLSNAVDRPVLEKTPEQIATQAAGVVGYQAGGQAFEGGGTVFNEPVLVVNQKAKIIEVNNEYGIFNQHGQQIGGVTQVGQSAAKQALRMFTSYDQFMTHRLVVHDIAGVPLLQLTRPAKVFKSTIIVQNGAGQEIGKIIQDNVFGKIHFSLDAGGHRYGSINAENWRAWNFSIQDHTGAEVARITKSWAGAVTEIFTTADNYVVQFHRQLEDPLLSMVVAAAVSVDTALKQDARGLG